ncbi:acyl-CoA dehydrogenase [Nocardioides marmoriginsengisoli]|uniref:Acyl-CoA dehydrogenase n=1 Tax=Nocardioides marmoriginsengisoli TaxID=661483 RepID=A0A3N0CAG9_9ACTN|nr:acyl-CoA dehydrogenase family protein [Nocardioides marmoriginsengisoli]RNL59963.1 acyl-CoA dehydrogenase [Nocardioides marmoriginsengisoli]
MDFSFTETQTDAADLAASIFKNECTPERLKVADRGRFDQELWSKLGDAGLLGLSLPESAGGAGLGLLELCSVLVEAGRLVAPVPLTSHLPSALALAEFGSAEVQGAWLPGAVSGSLVLTAAVAEEREHVPASPSTVATAAGDGWTLTGVKSVVPSGTVASLFLVPASTADGVGVFLVEPGTAGVTVTPQKVSDGAQVARLELADAAGTLLGSVGTGVAEWLEQRLTLAASAYELGVVRGALDLTAAYAKTREQFGRPIGTFQAVSQRLADGYIDVLGSDLMLWQAAWRLEEGLDAATEIASAKLWAADTGHKIAHTTVHVHGGVGIDMDGEAHRYFTTGKLGEFLLGGTTDQARRIGALLAASPV